MRDPRVRKSLTFADVRVGDVVVGGDRAEPIDAILREDERVGLLYRGRLFDRIYWYPAGSPVSVRRADG